MITERVNVLRHARSTPRRFQQHRTSRALTIPAPSRFSCQLMSVSVLAPSPRQDFGQLLHLPGGGPIWSSVLESD